MPEADNTLPERKVQLLSKECTVEGRHFMITLLPFPNGCFVSISEDEKQRLGSITLSVRSAGHAISSPLIPESKGSLFASMVGEMLAQRLGGMAITSMYLRSEIGASGMKTLISEVRKLLETG